ncbi:MAG: glycosyltransferase, partial [Phycisphaerae bacterium]
AALSEHNNVAYVETMGGRMPRLSEMGRLLQRIGRILHGVRRGTSRGLDPHNVHIFSPLAIPIHNNRLIVWVNRQALVFQLRRLMAKLGMERPIIWSFSPRWQMVAERLDHACLIFHCVDGLHTYDASEAFKAQFERTASSADMVFTPGRLLYDELVALNPNTHRIGHGCAETHLAFRDDGRSLPELADVPEPRVIYSGTLANWIDYDLMIRLAELLHEMSFVVIGYVHALALRPKVDALLGLPNVHAVGYQNFSRLPRFYSRSAVGIVPYQADNEHIRYSTPTKFLDYVAAGLPCVSTRFPAAEELGAFCAIADTPEDFAAAIREAIADDDATKRAARRAYAAEHSWERQVATMCGAIGQVLRAQDTGQ